MKLSKISPGQATGTRDREVGQEKGGTETRVTEVVDNSSVQRGRGGHFILARTRAQKIVAGIPLLRKRIRDEVSDQNGLQPMDKSRLLEARWSYGLAAGS